MKRNACALNVTYLGAPWIQWKEILQTFSNIGPVPEGYSDSELLRAWKRLDISFEKVKRAKDLKVSEFCKKFSQGNYVLSFEDHFSIVVDGEILDFDKTAEYFEKEKIKFAYQL